MAKKTAAKKKAPEPVVETEDARQYGGRARAVKTCKFCGHDYLYPCDDERKSTCRNWIHLQSQKKAGK